MHHKYTFLLVSILLLTACGDLSEEEGPEASVGAASTPIGTAPRLTEPDTSKLNAVVNQQNALALRLHKEMTHDEGNGVFSPLSINTFLGQLYAASSGETRLELEEKLGLPVTDDAYHEACNAQGLGMAERYDVKGVTLDIANHSWFGLEREVNQEFLDTLAANYGSEARRIDFATDPEGAREAINARIDNDTRGLIEEFLQPGDVTTQTNWLLFNSVYFKADWLYPFDPRSTYDDTFTNLGGDEVQTPTMHTSGFLSAASTETFDAVALPYKSNKAAMLYIVPKGDFEAFEDDFDITALTEVTSAMRSQEVNVSVPRLELKTRVRLDVKMAAALDLDVNAGSYENLGPNTHVNTVIHETVIIVNEEGTEAAGVTGGGNNGAGPIEPPLQIDVDRPYLFFVMDTETRAILFQGRVISNP
jgi:serpin B